MARVRKFNRGNSDLNAQVLTLVPKLEALYERLLEKKRSEELNGKLEETAC